MEVNEFQRWDPQDDLPSTLYFYDLHDKGQSLTVFLKEFNSEEKTLKITFEGVLAYRVVQEAGRLKTLGDSSLNTFATSKDSEFLRWFKEESLRIFEDWTLTHYVICNSDNLIDVISGAPIKVEWVKCES